MSRERPLPPEVQTLLDHEREIPPLPAAVRARALARARAALVAGAVPRRAVHAPPARTRWAAAAALILVGGATVGAAAYQIHARLAPAPSAPAVPPVVHKAAPAPVAVAPAPVPEIADEAPAAPRLSPADAARAELRLLRQARASVARGAYAAALQPIAEHARRFKAGRLAEEREALRVKALAGLGRTEEAQRAADAFRARFPRSVLLPAVSRMPASER